VWVAEATGPAARLRLRRVLAGILFWQDQLAGGAPGMPKNLVARGLNYDRGILVVIGGHDDAQARSGGHEKTGGPGCKDAGHSA